MSVNKVILIGNVGKDPQVRYIAENKPYASFSLATSDPAYTTEAGVQIPERTEWHNIVMWGKNAEIAEKYIRKGTKLYIEGKLSTRVWEDRNTIKHYVTEIHVERFEFLGQPRQQEPRAKTSTAPPRLRIQQAWRRALLCSPKGRGVSITEKFQELCGLYRKK